MEGKRLAHGGEGERGSADRSGRTGSKGSVGGSNRLLSVQEVADYLGVPKKTVYACWRSWGLHVYKVGRHLKFRQRHVEDWLDDQEV
ncbi:helix-turn-helix domain-containing protein [Streptosporangiaceae bacterium NEAU-GS5]|nr:helix-turn-helix domain-containing protein [Streptosporangiaceae bacterium NEAU-GS5]